MEANEQQRFDTLYAQHLRALKLRGYSASTIDVYARAVRRLTEHFDCVVDARSWGTVRVDRNGLQFFWKFILKQDWRWVEIIKPPKVRTLPDVLTVAEVQKLISVARQERYQQQFRGQFTYSRHFFRPDFCGRRSRPVIDSIFSRNASSPSGRPVLPCKRNASFVESSRPLSK